MICCDAIGLGLTNTVNDVIINTYLHYKCRRQILKLTLKSYYITLRYER